MGRYFILPLIRIDTQKLGVSKNFKCPSCTYCADRDANGARNILLRYLTIMDNHSVFHFRIPHYVILFYSRYYGSFPVDTEILL